MKSEIVFHRNKLRDSNASRLKVWQDFVDVRVSPDVRAVFPDLYGFLPPET